MGGTDVYSTTNTGSVDFEGAVDIYDLLLITTGDFTLWIVITKTVRDTVITGGTVYNPNMVAYNI